MISGCTNINFVYQHPFIYLGLLTNYADGSYFTLLIRKIHRQLIERPMSNIELVHCGRVHIYLATLI